eukprot:3396448-Amphidinium_carterae.1
MQVIFAEDKAPIIALPGFYSSAPAHIQPDQNRPKAGFNYIQQAFSDQGAALIIGTRTTGYQRRT